MVDPQIHLDGIRGVPLELPSDAVGAQRVDGRFWADVVDDPVAVAIGINANGIYSEDLLAITAATFFDVERIEVLRGPQGTLYGRNAVGGAFNILYKQPTYEYEGTVKALVGNFGSQEISTCFESMVVPFPQN
ncbi:MAG: TonB-dependent receptor plug domain-containing protein [Pseudomonadales bacterium]